MPNCVSPNGIGCQALGRRSLPGRRSSRELGQGRVHWATSARVAAKNRCAKGRRRRSGLAIIGTSSGRCETTAARGHAAASASTARIAPRTGGGAPSATAILHDPYGAGCQTHRRIRRGWSIRPAQGDLGQLLLLSRWLLVFGQRVCYKPIIALQAGCPSDRAGRGRDEFQRTRFPVAA